ncbi:MAG: hypothetical protein ACE5EL_02090, partial [Anaerolineae bacterium]
MAPLAHRGRPVWGAQYFLKCFHPLFDGLLGLVIHPVEHDLIVGTHGRAAFIIDDLAPLREIDAAVLDRPLHLFPIPDAR